MAWIFVTGRIKKDPASEQVPVKIGDQRANVTQGVPFSIRIPGTLQVLDVTPGALVPRLS